MKVVLINHYKAGFPFIDELARKLQQKRVNTIILDIYDMLSVQYENDEKIIEYHIKNKYLKQALKVPKIGSFAKKVFYKRFLEAKHFRGAHISIHFVSPYYTDFLNFFKKESSSISTVVWGSDFYRANKHVHNSIEKIFDTSDDIIIGNTKMASDFTSFYGKYSEKIRSVGFGIGKLDLINQISHETNLDLIKQELNIPLDKIIVTIGYNGIKEQQHLLIFNAIKQLPNELKHKLFLNIPFGYGGNKSYKAELINSLENLGVRYFVFEHFLSDIEIAKLRLCTDLVINAQISDASSASLQEHLYAENVLLVGDWLPYKYFKDNDIKLWDFTFENLVAKLKVILNNFEEYQKQVSGNKEKVYKLSSWDARIDQWIEVYKN